jgi:hypothetical protein
LWRKFSDKPVVYEINCKQAAISARIVAIAIYSLPVVVAGIRIRREIPHKAVPIFHIRFPFPERS